MSCQSSSRVHLRQSDYDSLDQNQDDKILEMQSLQSHQSESPSTPQIVSSSPVDSPMTIGFGVWVAIATSFVILVEAVVFLTWLWFEDRESESWRRLMLSGRATQYITLMSVLIRWAIGTLAAITISMAASIALELHGVPMSALAETLASPPYDQSFALVAASQFASTLLVTDLRELTILSLKKNISYGFTFGAINEATYRGMTPLPLRTDGLEYWSRAPSQSEIFADYSEPGVSSDELDDTGTVLRAFLPFSTKAQRESIQSFNGIAQIIDTHVVCVRPSFTAKYCRSQHLQGVWYLCLNATADLSNFPPYHIYTDTGLSYFVPGENDKQISRSFICQIPRQRPYDATWRKWLLCENEFLGERKAVALDSPLGRVSTSLGKYGFKRLADLSFSKVNGLPFESGPTNATWTLLNSTNSGPWARQWNRVKLRDGIKTRDEYTEITLCIGSELTSQVEHVEITASAASSLTEPDYQFNKSSNEYNTSAILRQFGAVGTQDRAMASRRQILNISPSMLNQRLQGRVRSPTTGRTAEDETGNWLSAMAFPDLAICSSCDYVTSQGSKSVRAVQPAEITTFDLVQAPARKWGFVTLMAIITGNIIIFLVMAFIFLCHTESSFLENAWHTVAQISQSDDVRPILEKATLASDQDIGRMIRGEETPKNFLGNVKDFFCDIGKTFNQRETKEERLVIDWSIHCAIKYWNKSHPYHCVLQGHWGWFKNPARELKLPGVKTSDRPLDIMVKPA
ncbi:uncharacterized protein FFB20_09253 [Fusarium fujikuroi]|nr:uncharacterized protein FFB20_09253 [Fusarium fujikuroi]SCO03029.1 uncharacterized protein FFE2_10157 [Fusarium fujikuroi]SCV51502.1 uncharacterized protein FFFS_09952 [Fusarium fujikuroi]